MSDTSDRKSEELQHYHTILRKMIEMADSFRTEIRDLRVEMLESFGKELDKYNWRIEKIEGEQKDLEKDVDKLATKLRAVEFAVDTNTRNTTASKARWAAVGGVMALFIGGGTLTVKDLLGTINSYESRSEAIAIAAGLCGGDKDTTERGGVRVPTVHCLNKHLAGRHAPQGEIDNALRWAGVIK